MRQVAKCECVHWPNWMRPDTIAMVSAVVNLEMKPEERKKILQDFGLLGSNTRFDKNGKETIYRSGHIFTLSKELGVISLEAALKK